MGGVARSNSSTTSQKSHRYVRRASPAQKPEATPSTPKSPKRVSLSSSVPYIVRCAGLPGVSGGRGRVLLIPSWMPTSVLETVRLGSPKMLKPLGIATLGMLGPSSATSGTTDNPGVASSALGLIVAAEPRCDDPAVAPRLGGRLAAERGREGVCACAGACEGRRSGWNKSFRSMRPPARSTKPPEGAAGDGDAGGSGYVKGGRSIPNGVEVTGWNSDVLKLKL